VLVRENIYIFKTRLLLQKRPRVRGLLLRLKIMEHQNHLLEREVPWKSVPLNDRLMNS